MNAVSQEQLSAQFLGDEAYAGARNFENLERAVAAVFGHSYVCPTHNVLGAIKLVLASLATPGSVVPTNHRTWVDILTSGGLDVVKVGMGPSPMRRSSSRARFQSSICRLLPMVSIPSLLPTCARSTGWRADTAPG